MVGKIQTFILSDGSTVAVEAEPLSGEEELISIGREEIVVETQKRFTEALSSTAAASREVLETFSMQLKPNSLELSFGLKFSAKAGIVLASADSEATIAVKAVWKPGT
jgi:hypothetical protein